MRGKSLKQLRFKYTVVTSPYFVLKNIMRAHKLLKMPEEKTKEQRYELALHIIDHMRRRSGAVTLSFGEENLPKEGGYILYSNHQGKYDALGILLTLPCRCAVLWEESSADKFLAREVCALLGGRTIDLTDAKKCLKTIKAIGEDVLFGERYLIFPEGGYADNKNTLTEFKSGCFLASVRSKTPVVPVCIFDSYRAMDENKPGRVVTQAHYLTPITYEQYKDMTRHELCEEVKKRIEDKLKTLKTIKYDKSLKNINALR